MLPRVLRCRSRFLAACVVALSAATAAPVLAAPDEHRASAVVSGTVLDSYGAPLADTYIVLYRTDGQPGPDAAFRSDESGNYTSQPTTIPPGEYVAFAARPFQSPSLNADTWSGNVARRRDAARLMIANGESHQLDFQMVRGGLVEGLVTRTGGKSTAGANVEIQAVRPAEEGRVFVGVDDSSRWQTVLAPGLYKLKVTPVPGTEAYDQVTYLGGGTSSTQAELLSISADETTTADVRLFQPIVRPDAARARFGDRIDVDASTVLKNDGPEGDGRPARLCGLETSDSRVVIRNYRHPKTGLRLFEVEGRTPTNRPRTVKFRYYRCTSGKAGTLTIEFRPALAPTVRKVRNLSSRLASYRVHNPNRDAQARFFFRAEHGFKNGSYDFVDVAGGTTSTVKVRRGTRYRVALWINQGSSPFYFIRTGTTS